MDHVANGGLTHNISERVEQLALGVFSGDGRRVLTMHLHDVVKVWDACAGGLITEIHAERVCGGEESAEEFSGIEAAALNHAGDLALLGLDDGTAGIFSVASGKRCTVLRRPDCGPTTSPELIRAVAFSPDESLALAAFSGLSVGVWRTATGELVRVLESSLDQEGMPTLLGTAVAVSRDNRYVFAGAHDLTAALWDLATGSELMLAAEHAEEPVAVWHDRATIRWATSGGKIWQATEEGVSRCLTADQSWTMGQFAVDGRSLVVDEPGNRLVRYGMDGASHDLCQGSFGIPGLFKLFGTRPSGLTWASARGAHSTSVFVGNQALRFPGEEVSFSRNDERVAVRDSRSIQVWDIATETRVWQREVGGGKGLAFSQSGDYVAAATSEAISLWSAKTGDLLHHWTTDAPTEALAFTATQNHLISVDCGRMARCWRVTSSGSEPACLANVECGCCRFARPIALRDGRVVLPGSRGSEIWREDLAERIAVLPTDMTSSGSWHISSDESTLAIAERWSVSLWSLHSGAFLKRVTLPVPHPDWVPAQSMPLRSDATWGIHFWKWCGTCFCHSSHSHRGWRPTFHLSKDERFVVIPCESSAALVELGENQRVVQEVPFNGLVLASCVTDDEILLMNAAGTIFRYPRKQ